MSAILYAATFHADGTLYKLSRYKTGSLRTHIVTDRWVRAHGERPQEPKPHDAVARALTPRQAELLDYIGDYIAEKRYAPTFDEMRLALNLKSASTIAALIRRLESGGFIERDKAATRSIRIISPR